MPQLSLYLTDEEMAALRKNAKKAGMSLSKYAAEAIEEKNNKKSREWPPGFFDLYGSLGDDFQAPEELDYADDLPRKSLGEINVPA